MTQKQFLWKAHSLQLPKTTIWATSCNGPITKFLCVFVLVFPFPNKELPFIGYDFLKSHILNVIWRVVSKKNIVYDRSYLYIEDRKIIFNRCQLKWNTLK